jgi:two-component system, chemotaxis family, chemotaxis protein CheY
MEIPVNHDLTANAHQVPPQPLSNEFLPSQTRNRSSKHQIRHFDSAGCFGGFRAFPKQSVSADGNRLTTRRTFMLRDRLEGRSTPKGPRVLVVDDSPFARRDIRLRLESFGFQLVGEAENGVEALRMFKELRPDMVTLDVIMPATDGVDSLSAFRAMKKENPYTIIVVVSANRFAKTREKFMEEGAFFYIVKPFTMQYFERLRIMLARAFPELPRF